MAHADAIFAAVRHIHEAPLMPDGWARALPSIASALRSERGILLVQNASRKAEYAVSFEMTSEQTAGVAGSRSKLWETIRALPAGSPAPASEPLPDCEYARTRFYNEGVRPLGAFPGGDRRRVSDSQGRRARRISCSARHRGHNGQGASESMQNRGGVNF